MHGSGRGLGVGIGERLIVVDGWGRGGTSRDDECLDVEASDEDAGASAQRVSWRRASNVSARAMARRTRFPSPLNIAEIRMSKPGGPASYLRGHSEARDIFRRAGDRWGLASTLWRIADLAIERGRLDEAEAALQEARTVLAPTQRERWIASTIAGLAEVSSLRGDAERAAELLADARRRYAAGGDAVGLANIDERLGRLAKGALSARKGEPGTTPRPAEVRRGRT